MIVRTKDLKGYILHCTDGEIGRVLDFYFDDHHWTVRYMVVDAGNWLLDRKVLVSPYAISGVNQIQQYFKLNISKKQLANSPSLETDKPVSRRFEEIYNSYFGWPLYWTGLYRWGEFPTIVPDIKMWKDEALDKKFWDLHLRSTLEVRGHDIQALDGLIGHVDDFVMELETWAIRYLVISLENWLPGKKVLVSPLWIDRISWGNNSVMVNLSKELIKESPEYKEEVDISRDYETILHTHYHKTGYWLEEKSPSLPE